MKKLINKNVQSTRYDVQFINKYVIAFFVFFVLFRFSLISQNISINTTGVAANAVALLEIGKGTLATPDLLGLLIPRVNLTATNSNAPIGAGIVTSLVVYNNATAGVAPNNVVPGYYYWDGTKWLRLDGGSGGLDWSLLGNASTVAGTNFIGTTDAVDLVIKTFNTERARFTGAATGTTQMSITAGASQANSSPLFTLKNSAGADLLHIHSDNPVNTFIGVSAGRANTVTASWPQGLYNTFVGANAGFSNTIAFSNTALGFGALELTTSGTQNTAIGFHALRANFWAGQNTAVGSGALAANTYATQNVAMGTFALETQSYANGNATWATNNVAVRFQALNKNQPTTNTNGYQNTAIGNYALLNNTTGSNNTASGYNALLANTTGSNNTALGYAAGVSTGALTNATAIGNGATVTASNNMLFGNTAVVGWGFGVAPGAVAIRVGTGATNGNGATLTLAGAWTNASDSTKKHGIINITYGLNEVMKLRPVNYKWKGTNQKDFGFLAQEVKLILPEIVYGEEGQMTISYGQITSVLTKAVQEQQKMIDELRVTNNELKSAKDNQQKEISELKSEIAEIKSLMGSTTQK